LSRWHALHENHQPNRSTPSGKARASSPVSSY
jgi:hypothetical protein